MAKVYIIWDNSNIHYGGLNKCFQLKNLDSKKSYIELIF